MRGANKSLSRELKGTVLEILGTAFSVGCQVDGKSPKEISDQIKEGSIDSECYCICTYFLLTRHSSRGVKKLNVCFSAEQLPELMIPMSKSR